MRNSDQHSEQSFLPDIHFAPSYGWINDPNGLVFHDGIYELYYQHNPDGIEWNRMTWGHARSTDMLHWEEMGDVLFPDENGTMFSGCAIRNEHGLLGLPRDALIYIYTAAGHNSEASDGKPFSIRMAHSLDGGRTLIKRDGKVIPSPGWESRDPKVFFHAPSGAYIMVLWIVDHIFGVWRSEDLVSFRQTQLLTLEGGFECPDLFELPVRDSTGAVCGSKYVFLAADGSYYVGTFDGYQFHEEQGRRRAYLCTPGGALPGNELPYAAQSFSGMGDRTVIVSWLRTRTVADRSTGAMSLPRELSLVRRDGKYLLRMALPEEITGQETTCGKEGNGKTFLIPDPDAGKGMRVRLTVDRTAWNSGTVYHGSHSEEAAWSAGFLGEDGSELLHIRCLRDTGMLQFRHGVVTDLMEPPVRMNNLELIYDRGILEVSAEGGTVNFVLDFPELRGERCLRFHAEEGLSGVECSCL